MKTMTKKQFNDALDEGKLKLGLKDRVISQNGNEYVIESKEVGNEVTLMSIEEYEELEES